MNYQDWGTISYKEATDLQLELVEKVSSKEIPSTIVSCTHPPIVTRGRGTQPGDVFGWKGEVYETSRGGRATYHGPNQIVVYPIINLSEKRDLHAHLRNMEAAIVETLNEFGIASEARSIPQEHGPSLTGVWVGDNKIASLGIAVKKWVTYHGLALNVTHDQEAFTGIHPCGFQTSVMTNMEKVLGHSVRKEKVLKTLLSCLEARLSS